MWNDREENSVEFSDGSICLDVLNCTDWLYPKEKTYSFGLLLMSKTSSETTRTCWLDATFSKQEGKNFLHSLPTNITIEEAALALSNKGK